MMSSSPCSALSRRALARISSTDIAAVSSMKIGASDSLPAARVSLGQSDSDKYPVRSRWASTRASEQSILRTSCSLDISRLKTATAFSLSIAAWAATFRQNAVFPMEGLPATMMRSLGWNPDVNLSISAKPLGGTGVVITLGDDLRCRVDEPAQNGLLPYDQCVIFNVRGRGDHADEQ